MKITGVLSDYVLPEPGQYHDVVKESWDFGFVDGRVKVLAQYRKGEAEDLAKIRRCLQMIVDIETENTTNGKKYTEEAAHRC